MEIINHGQKMLNAMESNAKGNDDFCYQSDNYGKCRWEKLYL